jgi:excisionase family DNA binding protein
MTTRELARYLKLHEITICKLATQGEIPGVRIGRVWRFDKELIDEFISGGEKAFPKKKKSQTKSASSKTKRHILRKKASNN